MAQPSPQPRNPADTPERPASIPGPRPAGESRRGARIDARAHRAATPEPAPEEHSAPLEAELQPASPLSPPAEPAVPPVPPSRPLPAHRPVLQPWEAANFDPEDIGAWGDKHRQDAPSHRRRSLRFGLLGLAVALTLGAVVAWQTAARPSPGSTTPPPAAIAVSAAPPPASPDSVRRAADAARAFLETSTLEARSRLVRHPEVTRERMAAWHDSGRPLVPLKVLSFHDRWSEEQVGTHTFLMLFMEMADFRTRAIALEKLPDDTFLVDWESFESWSDMPWSRFLATEPVGSAEFRVVVQPDTYFNFAYRDPAAWLCFRLTDPANQDHCWGYCPVKSEAAYGLGHLLRRQRQQGAPEAKAILRLRFDGGDPGRRQVLIDSLVEESWVKPDP